MMQTLGLPRIVEAPAATSALTLIPVADTVAGTKANGWVTGIDISMDPDDPNSIGYFLPQLATTVE